LAERPVRTRVAPSPTGDPHVGTAYAALFNHVLAKSRGGQFILRIEDTDRVRSTPESERAIIESLRWLGIAWDEGPDVGGPFGPYRQSERWDIYREHVQRLLDAGHAYRCFCTRERLDAVRTRQGAATGYDRHCRDLDPADVAKRAAAGEEHVVRMKVPTEGECVMHDLLRGEIRREWALVDDQVVLKSDGYPTYHLANVVDDHLMGISHVLRGEEWINSVPKHLLLYEYFGWEPPVFCHLPLLRNADANKSKLSKRKNPTSINYYRRAGFLPEAMVNFLGMMGWIMPNGEEKFSIADMVANFKPEAISLGGPVFDADKLRWLNGRYIRENYDTDTLYGALGAWALNKTNITRLLPLIQPRLETLSDFGRLAPPFFRDAVDVNPADLKLKGKTDEELVDILQMTLWRLDGLRAFTAEAVQAVLEETAAAFEIKPRDFNVPFYVALSGSPVWTPLYGSMEALGSDMVRVRLRRAIEVLGGVSGKRMKKLEKDYEDRFGPRE